MFAQFNYAFVAKTNRKKHIVSLRNLFATKHSGGAQIAAK